MLHKSNSKQMGWGGFRETLEENRSSVVMSLRPITPKTTIFDYVCAADSVGVASFRLAPKSIVLGEVTQNNGHCAVQGH